VPEADIIGHPLLIYWSFNETSEENRQPGLSDRIAHGAKAVLHFFDDTRWKRLLVFSDCKCSTADIMGLLIGSVSVVASWRSEPHWYAITFL